MLAVEEPKDRSLVSVLRATNPLVEADQAVPRDSLLAQPEQVQASAVQHASAAEIVSPHWHTEVEVAASHSAAWPTV